MGISTVPEAMVANGLGMEVAAISCISNLAAERSTQALSHEDVQKTSELVLPKMTSCSPSAARPRRGLVYLQRKRAWSSPVGKEQHSFAKPAVSNRCYDSVNKIPQRLRYNQQRKSNLQGKFNFPAIRRQAEDRL